MEKTFRKHKENQEWYYFKPDGSIIVVCNDERKMIAVFGEEVKLVIVRHSNECTEAEFMKEYQEVMGVISIDAHKQLNEINKSFDFSPPKKLSQEELMEFIGKDSEEFNRLFESGQIGGNYKVTIGLDDKITMIE